ncbi:MAG: RNA-processing protein [Thermoplasmata archaeon]|mgnify:CR=1 FL=1|nr:MAG: RNA-processing protein [Thermoplasmata archaeon]MCD6146695.1 RNA-processing protein [Thermoplasmata archaeon]RLF45542.1 MAG: RNA-processing protein [Thermoplasmata archaeon]RLF48568.1 MAG: RNA-processing protein [Thermoplasmata archaeon]HDH81473.1 RNA-processing protein [Thermoplasmatales archaeon]
MRFVKIPAERVAVLIGKNGEVKKKIEEQGVKLDIDSKSGDVSIKGDDAVTELDAQNVVKAIGRGFSPQHAMLLFRDDHYFELLDMRDYVGKKAKNVHRIAGRIIGKGGKTRAIIESMTGVRISVYGTTVGVIGKVEGMDAAIKAIEMLLNGSNHSTVYRFLEKEKERMKLAEFGIR